MNKCKAATTLMNANEKLKAQDGTEMVGSMRFRSLVGKLLFLSYTRPDIVFAVSLVSRYK